MIGDCESLHVFVCFPSCDMKAGDDVLITGGGIIPQDKEVKVSDSISFRCVLVAPMLFATAVSTCSHNPGQHCRLQD